MFQNEVHGTDFGTSVIPVGTGVHDATCQALQRPISGLHELLSTSRTLAEIGPASEADVVAILTHSYGRLHVLEAYRAF
jgi:hypothetical protein